MSLILISSLSNVGAEINVKYVRILFKFLRRVLHRHKNLTTDLFVLLIFTLLWRIDGDQSSFALDGKYFYKN